MCALMCGGVEVLQVCKAVYTAGPPEMVPIVGVVLARTPSGILIYT